MAVNTNPLSYNAWVDNMGVMAVAITSGGAVHTFNDVPLQTIASQMLNYAELRIQRDLDLLPAQTSNVYILNAGANVFPLSVDDFLTVQTVEVTQMNGGLVVNATPLIQVSKEFIQNVYGGLASANTPKFYALYGDNFGNGGDVNNNILLGPVPNYSYTIRITGTIRTPSLYKSAQPGNADTQYTYISSYYPDLLIMACMIYISMYQRNFSATSDDPQMGASYEKQYQALMTVAKMEENRKKGEGSGWSAYSTPVSATPTR